MPQKTNLNISPYYDDFDKEDKFYKVLFKPGFPVQARELTTLQSQLQNQIESFGSHIFKDGSMVIPGAVSYDSLYYSIKIKDEHLGIPVSLYLDQLVGLILKGQTSGISLKIDSYLLAGTSPEINDLTIFVTYLESGDSNDISYLTNGETLITQETFIYGNTAINEGETVLSLVDDNASAVGSAVGISSGTYFIRGSFVDVSTDKIVLDPYKNDSSYRVGLNIDESIVTAKEDDSLYDNARGFSNYAAPGADRLKITTTLAKKSLNDYNDTNFIELIRIKDGEIASLINDPQYSLIRSYFAKRTFDESGHYAVEPFTIQVANSLNDGISNEGLFKANEITEENNIPDDDLMCVKISAGTAYVKGFDVDIEGTEILDVDKPRDKKEVESALVPYQMGTILKVNNVFGTAVQNINDDTKFLELYAQRTGSNSSGTGELVGQARVYSFAVSDAAYSGDSTEWDLHLFDIQTFIRLTLNSSVTNAQVPDASYVRGLSSGAHGYTIASGGNSDVVKITQVTGTFMQGEQIIFNEDPQISRSIKTVRTFGIQDVKSVFQQTSALTGHTVDFVADTVLQRKIPTGFSITDKININASGIATCPGGNFTGIKTDTIVRYQLPNEVTERFNRVTEVLSDGSISLAAVASITGICNGALPGTTNTTTTFAFGVPNIKIENNKGLFANIGDKNISDINLSNSNLVVGKSIINQSTSGSGALSMAVGASGISSAFFDAFDEERYSIHYANGLVETLTSDQVTLGTQGQSITFQGLSQTGQSNNVVVTTTIKKQDLKSKQKNYIRSEKLSIENTRVEINTALTGMTKSTGYGLRVEDREISLNQPDVVKVIGVFESIDSNSPVLDKLTFPSGLSLNTNAILGEKIKGSDSEAIAQITSLLSSTEVEIVYLTSNKFIKGEVVNFDESKISTTLQVITEGGSLNITNIFDLDKGQRDQFYDYSRLVRRSNFAPPTRKLLVVFDRYDVPSNDTGDFYTVASYDEERFSSDIPNIGRNNVRATDTIDFRPRVSQYTGNESPFAFQNRLFGASGNVNPSFVVTPNESSILGYKHYLPRIDKVILTEDGDLTVLKGVSSINPIEPLHDHNHMDIATITLPAYLYDPDDAVVKMVDNQRYTMRDIGGLEDRIENLEKVTSLSLLELDTKTLQVQDADGLSRFKSGFFVDDFKNADLLDNDNLDCKVTVDTQRQELNVPIDFWSIGPQVALDLSINSDTADFSQNLALLDSNCRKTGEVITLNYDEVEAFNQPLASRVENVNPFNMIDFDGFIRLRPESDTWIRTIETTGRTIRRTGARNRTFAQRVVTSTTRDEHIRSRNVSFDAIALRPYTRYYAFFEGTSGLDIIPKLVEVDMVNGIFQPGETVKVVDSTGKTTATLRLARPDHKRGDIANPTERFASNPYNPSDSFGTSYSASSSVLNVDIVSLSDEAQGSFFGYIDKNSATILGTSSGAQATIKPTRLVADRTGEVIGSFFFRNPLASPPPALRFRTGISTFRLTSSPDNSESLPGSLLISDGEVTYDTEGGQLQLITVNTIVETVPPPPRPVRRGGGGGRNRRRRRPRRRGGSNAGAGSRRGGRRGRGGSGRGRGRGGRGGRGRGGRDPLAQSFTVDETGMNLTSVDLFFGTKDPIEKLTVEVRPMELGTPTAEPVDAFSQVVVSPDQINVSSDASVATRITFPSPIHLEPAREYCIVLIAPTTNNYEAWVARMGEKTVNSQTLPDAESVIVTKQYVGGSLFKSQNGTIWTPSQFEDLKFRLNKANFIVDTPGTAFFYNPKLDAGNSINQRLLPNSITTLPRKLKVGIQTTTHAQSIAKMGLGVQVSDGTATSDIQGYIEQVGGPVGTLAITNAGRGFDGGPYQNVPLYSITGNGTGATATVTIGASGQVSSISLTSNTGGSGYVVGDVLGITTSSTTKGSDAQITVASINGTSTLYLNNVQGEEFTTGDPIVVYEGSTATSYGSTLITSSQTYDASYTGNVIDVSHYNHGMQADTNLVTLADIEPNTTPIALTDNLDVSDQVISVASTTPFATFNGISTSQGYLKINGEIIYYNSIATNQLGIGTRGVDNTIVRTHSIDDLARKYELNGIDLRKINTDHNMPNDPTLSARRTIDHYHLQIDRPIGIGDNQTSFIDEQHLGGENIFASQNYQFNNITIDQHTQIPSADTTLTAQIRTVSGTSAGGNEVPFIDQGFEDISIGSPNPLDSPRMICSKVNENARLSTLPLNKSFTLGYRLETSDPNLSPRIDTLDAQVILERSRLNKPILDYVNDDRSNEPSDDPHAAIYISNRVDLKNPATSLKLLVGAFRHPSADFRVLYQLFREDGAETDLSYELFPGFDNLQDTDGDGFGDRVIDPSKNSGRPDAFVSPSEDGEFKEYQFSIDDLDEFTGFKFKIVMSGTNEAFPPRLKDIRAIALA